MRTSAQHLTRSAQDTMSTLETMSEKPSVDVTFTEQSLHVQLTLHKAGTVWLDCVEPQSAAHGRVNVGMVAFVSFGVSKGCISRISPKTERGVLPNN